MLDEEARLAHEFVGTLRGDLGSALGPLLGVGDFLFFLVVVLVVLDDETVLEDDVEAGFYIVGVEDLLIVVVLVLFLGRRFGLGLGLGLGLGGYGALRNLLVLVLGQFVVVAGDLVL